MVLCAWSLRRFIPLGLSQGSVYVVWLLCDFEGVTGSRTALFHSLAVPRGSALWFPQTRRRLCSLRVRREQKSSLPSPLWASGPLSHRESAEQSSAARQHRTGLQSREISPESNQELRKQGFGRMCVDSTSCTLYVQSYFVNSSFKRGNGSLSFD